MKIAIVLLCLVVAVSCTYKDCGDFDWTQGECGISKTDASNGNGGQVESGGTSATWYTEGIDQSNRGGATVFVYNIQKYSTNAYIRLKLTNNSPNRIQKWRIFLWVHENDTVANCQAGWSSNCQAEQRLVDGNPQTRDYGEGIGKYVQYIVWSKNDNGVVESGATSRDFGIEVKSKTPGNEIAPIAEFEQANPETEDAKHWGLIGAWIFVWSDGAFAASNDITSAEYSEPWSAGADRLARTYEYTLDAGEAGVSDWDFAVTTNNGCAVDWKANCRITGVEENVDGTKTFTVSRKWYNKQFTGVIGAKPLICFKCPYANDNTDFTVSDLNGTPIPAESALVAVSSSSAAGLVVGIVVGALVAVVAAAFVVRTYYRRKNEATPAVVEMEQA